MPVVIINQTIGMKKAKTWKAEIFLYSEEQKVSCFLRESQFENLRVFPSFFRVNVLPIIKFSTSNITSFHFIRNNTFFKLSLIGEWFWKITQ